jgi:hypothetical protein
LKDKSVLKRCAFPSLRRAVGDAGVFVAGEAEADEPFSVKLSRCILQQRHPPPIVLDQVVVGGEDFSDSPLFINARYRQFER